MFGGDAFLLPHEKWKICNENHMVAIYPEFYDMYIVKCVQEIEGIRNRICSWDCDVKDK